MQKCPVCKIVMILAGFGALNWGVVAAIHMDFVAKAFGASHITRIIYGLIGIAGLITLISVIKPCPCGKKN